MYKMNVELRLNFCYICNGKMLNNMKILKIFCGIYDISAVRIFICFALMFCVLSKENYAQFNNPNPQKVIENLNHVKINTPDTVAALYYYNAAYYSESNADKIKYYTKALNYASKNRLDIIGNGNYLVAQAYWYSNESQTALNHALTALKIFLQRQDTIKIVDVYTLAAQCYINLSKRDSVFYYFSLAEQIYLDKQDTVGLATVYRGAGLAAQKMSFLDIAEEYYNKAFYLDSVASIDMDMGLDYYYIGYLKLNVDNKLAIENFRKSVDILTRDDLSQYYRSYLNFSYGGLARAYLQIAEKTGDDRYADTSNLYNQRIGDFFFNKGDWVNYMLGKMQDADYLCYKGKSKEALNLMLSLKKYLGSDEKAKFVEVYNELLMKIYIKLGDYKNAFDYQKKFYEHKIEYINDSTVAALINFQSDHALAMEKDRQKRVQQAAQSEKKFLKTVAISLGAFLTVTSILVFYVLKMLKIKKKANNTLMLKNRILAIQKDEIESQKSEIENQKSEIETQKNIITSQWEEVENVNKKLLNSISYAQRIQRAAISSPEDVTELFKENFVYYRPRDIVSGDFYQALKCGKYSVMITADCTGHGIPGAFLSMLGISSLKEFMVTEHDAENPGTVLDRMRNFIKTTLASSATKTIDDGMDMTICCFDFEKMELIYAIANQIAYIIRAGEAIKLKGDTMPVGRYVREKEHFQTLKISLKHGDMVYMYSDGIQDQLGGDLSMGFGKKFLGKNLVSLLTEAYSLEPKQQKELVHQRIMEWRSGRSQVDDITMIGIRV